MAVPITPVRLGDVVRLEKPHPCGTNEWEIARVGADIRLKCRGCDRSVMLERYEFDRRFRGFVERASAEGPIEPKAPGGVVAGDLTDVVAPAADPAAEDEG